MTKVERAKAELIKAMIEEVNKSNDEEAKADFFRTLDNQTAEEIVKDSSEALYVIKQFWNLFE